MSPTAPTPSRAQPAAASVTNEKATRAPPNTLNNVQIRLEQSVSAPYAHGAFSHVYVASLSASDGTHKDQVAVKKCVAKKTKSERRRHREINMFKLMQKDLVHANIVHLLYYFQTTPDNEHIITQHVFEFMATDLSKHLRPMRHATPPQRPNEQLPRVWTYQLFLGLDHLNKLNVCHRDLKPSNLLLNPDTHQLKIGDFGSARILDGLPKPDGWYVVTRYYRPPEMLMHGVDYLPSADWWSAGCVVAEMCTAQPLFDAPTSPEQIKRIAKFLGKPTREQLLEMNIPMEQRRKSMGQAPPARVLGLNRALPAVLPPAVALIGQLLRYTPSQRITPAEVLSSEYLQALGKPPHNVLPDGSKLPFTYTHCTSASGSDSQSDSDSDDDDEDDSSTDSTQINTELQL